jgi:hypothetical protein
LRQCSERGRIEHPEGADYIDWYAPIVTLPDLPQFLFNPQDPEFAT